jgi:two-component system response regulator NreC
VVRPSAGLGSGPATGDEPKESVVANARTEIGCEPLRVLLAVLDFPVLSLGLRAAIDAETDMRVVGELRDSASLRDALNEFAPDVVVTEYSAAVGAGGAAIETIETIREVSPGARVLTVATRTGTDEFSLALKAGVDGYLTRDAGATELPTAIRCVAAGQTYVSPAIVTRMVNTYVHGSPAGSLEDPYDQLSEREREVLLLAASGHTNREIAQIFHLSEQTIHNYRAGVMEKLGFHDRVELLRYAIRRGVISVADL